jgi:branched-chain amino acid transport system permease protein
MDHMNGAMLIQLLVNGISLGSLYALIAIGYTMVYGIVRLINFAHGDIIMLAAYFVYFGYGLFKLPWLVAVIGSILLTAIIGMMIEKAAYKPLRDAPRISVLISAIGVSFFLENLAIVIFGGRPQRFYTPEIFLGAFQFSEVRIPHLGIYIPVITFALLAILLYLVNQTPTGMAMRACSRDMDTAKLMSIDVNGIISLTFGLGSALAAVGGILWSLKYPQIYPLLGMMPGLKCFIAAVVGGIGNIEGAVIGGFVLGLGEIMLVGCLPALSGYRDAFAFIILILILLVRPTGILGEKITEKV